MSNGAAPQGKLNKIDFAKLRKQMVEQHIARRGVRSTLVLRAMGAVPREAFLPEELWEFAYEDRRSQSPRDRRSRSRTSSR